jgi:hypothetical protein
VHRGIRILGRWGVRQTLGSALGSIGTAEERASALDGKHENIFCAVSETAQRIGELKLLDVLGHVLAIQWLDSGWFKVESCGTGES